MKVYLAGLTALKPDLIKLCKYKLESFFYIKDNMLPYIDENFLLDSGAFTFMSSKKKEKINWDDYINKYIDFINTHNIKYFFELDIDSILGIQKVKQITNKIEAKTNKQCIPVWHKSRGIDYWEYICKNYNYVSIGGIVSKEIKKKDFKYLPKLLEIAKNNNCKVHGLGFTWVNELNYIKFDTVDSTYWSYGNRFGFLFLFKDKKMMEIDRPYNTKIKTKEAMIHNYHQWLNFQKYAENNL